jgi:hypothetical protein
MGYQLSTASTAIPKGTEPDWEAARHAIDTIELRTLWGTDDDLYLWELWQDEFPSPPDPYGTYFGMHAARESLEYDLAVIRRTFEAGPGPELLIAETPGHLLYVTGGVTVGEDPTELWSPLAEVGETGALRAAGFTRWERFSTVPIDERTDGFRGADRVRVAAARALLSIVDDVEALAERDDSPEPADDPAWWAERIERALRVAEVRLGPAALLALATDLFDLARRVHAGGPSLAIVCALEGLEGSPERPLAGSRDIRHHTRRLRRTWNRAVRDLFTITYEEPWRVAGDVLPAALLALGAARPDGIAELRPRRADRPWPEVVITEGEADLDDYIEWWMLPAAASIDWDAASRAARGDAELTEAVDRVRIGVEAEYHRLVETIELPDATVWITGGTHRPDSDVVTHARRAREAGLLEAAGFGVRTNPVPATQAA